MRLTVTSLLLCIAVSLSAPSVQQRKTDAVTTLVQEYYKKKHGTELTNASVSSYDLAASLLTWLDKK